MVPPSSLTPTWPIEAVKMLLWSRLSASIRPWQRPQPQPGLPNVYDRPRKTGATKQISDLTITEEVRHIWIAMTYIVCAWKRIGARRHVENQGFWDKLCASAPSCGWRIQECSLLQLLEGLLQLFLGIHDDRSIPGDRFFEWFSRNQQEPDAVLPGLHFDLITGVEQNQLQQAFEEL